MTIATQQGRPVFAVRLTLVVSIVLPLVLLSGIAIYTGLSAVEDNLEERLREDLELVARAASGPLSQAMSEQDGIVLGETLESIFRIGRVYGASVYDRDGRQVASLGVTSPDLNTSRRAAEVIDSGLQEGDFRNVSGVDVFSQFTPLIGSNGRIVGLLQITRKRSDFQEMLAATRGWAIAGWSLLSLIVTFVVVLGHYGSIGRHVSRLLAAMDKLAPGQWTLAPEASGPREIQDIHQGLRNLTARMAAAEAEILDRMERERSLAEKLEYQEKVAMIGRVAGGVAHELGAPLSVIDGRANVLARSDASESQHRHIRDIRAQVARMTKIIEQLLDCFRHVPDARRPIDLGALLRELVPQMLEQPPCINVQAQTHGLDQNAWVKAEPTRISLALINVVRNACQAAESQVRLILKADSGHWQLHVEDDGPGIAPQDRHRVFEPFHTTRPAGEGTGLGLAIVHSIVKEHRGRVEIADSELGGCLMVLSFPAVEPGGGASQSHPGEDTND